MVQSGIRWKLLVLKCRKATFRLLFALLAPFFFNIGCSAFHSLQALENVGSAVDENKIISIEAARANYVSKHKHNFIFARDTAVDELENQSEQDKDGHTERLVRVGQYSKNQRTSISPQIYENALVSTIRAKDNMYYSLCYPKDFFQKLPKSWKVGDSLTEYVHDDWYRNLSSKFFRLVPKISFGYIPQNKGILLGVSIANRFRLTNPESNEGDDSIFDLGFSFGGLLNFQHLFHPVVHADLSNVWDVFGAGAVLGLDFDFDIKYTLYRAGFFIGCTYNAFFGGSPFKYCGYQVAPCMEAKVEFCGIEWGKNMIGLSVGWKYGGIFTGVYGSF